MAYWSERLDGEKDRPDWGPAALVLGLIGAALLARVFLPYFFL